MEELFTKVLPHTATLKPWRTQTHAANTAMKSFLHTEPHRRRVADGQRLIFADKMSTGAFGASLGDGDGDGVLVDIESEMECNR